MIVFKNISYNYPGNDPVLTNIDYTVDPGLTLLTGPNGSGKSTLLRLAAGVEKPGSGFILINGKDLWKEEVKARMPLHYMPEFPDLSPYATIGEIVRFVCRVRGVEVSAGIEALKRTDLIHLAGRTVRELSNGQRRRAHFALCLIGDGKVVILDEPLEGMDRNVKNLMVNWVEKRKKTGATILIASHTMEPFLPLTDQFLSLDQGEIQLIENPHSKTV